jgi:hypothetical protein
VEDAGREGEDVGREPDAEGASDRQDAMPDPLGSLLVSISVGAVAAVVASLRGAAWPLVLLAYSGAGAATLVAVPLASRAVRALRRRLRRHAGGGADS